MQHAQGRRIFTDRLRDQMMVDALLTNCHTCKLFFKQLLHPAAKDLNQSHLFIGLYGSNAAHYFGVMPPILEEYLDTERKFWGV
jgi:hypothetical protein